MAQIKGFFFDLDGTLVDTHHANYEAYKRAIAEHGVSIEFDTFKQTIGMQAMDFLPILAPGLERLAYEDISQAKKHHYKTTMQHTVLNERLVAFITYVKQHDYKVALVTTAKRENAETVLQHHNLKQLFDVLVTAEDVIKSKPDPACYVLALEKTNLKPEEVIAFEDSATGIKSAEAARIPVIQIKDFLL